MEIEKFHYSNGLHSGLGPQWSGRPWPIEPSPAMAFGQPMPTESVLGVVTSVRHGQSAYHGELTRDQPMVETQRFLKVNDLQAKSYLLLHIDLHKTA
jgi:hypothetical protein